MKKRMFLIIALILLTLALAVVPALAESGIERGKPPVDDTPTPTPDIGELYGDLYVILRDEYGAPLKDAAHQCIQPIASKDLVTTEWDEDLNLPYATTTIASDTGNIEVRAYPGEPFQLPYYTLDGDLVACELTEEMATWVQTVDFGRLNLGRAPNAVIDHALDEAINKMNLACAMGLDPAGRIMLDLDEVCLDRTEDWVTIDAPAENLALYIKLMTDGHWIIPENTPTSRKGGDPAADEELRPVLSEQAKTLIRSLEDGAYSNLVDKDSTVADLDASDLRLAASLLAGAGDKFGTITLDMVVYINSIYGINQAADTPNGYFNFAQYQNGGEEGRDDVYSGRISIGTNCLAGQIYVLQPETVNDILYYRPQCVSTMTMVHFHDYMEEYFSDDLNAVPLYTDYLEYTTNVRGFAQAADDALQVLEYAHNYSVPEVLYADD